MHNLSDKTPGSIDLPNSVGASITRINGRENIHLAVLGDTLQTVVREEAKTHGAHFDSSRFGRVVQSILEDEMQAYILVVTLPDRVPEIAGGAIQFPTVYTKWVNDRFVHSPAIYNEDTYVRADLSAEFRRQTVSPLFPKGIGLGTFFISERIRQSAAGESPDEMPFGVPASCRVAEHGEGNMPIIGIYNKLNAKQETNARGSVLLLSEAPRFDIDSSCCVSTELLITCENGRSKAIHDNIFTTSWRMGKQAICASFTKGMSTFTGDDIARVQFTSNGDLPRGKKLQSVLGALLEAGKEEIVSRDWLKKQDEAQSDYCFLRIHALNEPKIVEALRSMGAQTRLLGPRIMKPVVIDYEDIAGTVFGGNLPKAKPFSVRVIRQSNSGFWANAACNSRKGCVQRTPSKKQKGAYHRGGSRQAAESGSLTHLQL